MMALPKLSTVYSDPFKYPEGVAFQDEQYLLMKDAKISVLDWGFLHSDATYDTVHVWDGAFFRLDLHLDRFFAGMEKLKMTIPYTRTEVSQILSNCVALSGHRNAYVEMICTRGGSPTFSRDPRDSVNRFMGFSVPFGSVANVEQMEHGLRLVVSDVVRIPPNSIDPTIKNYHWLDLVCGLYDAYDKGAETAVLLDTNGNITEGPGFNIFVVKDGKLYTPKFGVLPGITRRTVFDLCEQLGFDAAAQDVSQNFCAVLTRFLSHLLRAALCQSVQLTEIQSETERQDLSQHRSKACIGTSTKIPIGRHKSSIRKICDGIG